ncbi:unnamed protein product [Vicia faba]|uniref:Uncharacterized protein n=1 Tax=Vicia faba TaxID=3906 RepID=A0AAV0ZWF9_VICFA|nr:unnamed protein product [Vicia faba]
MMKIGGGIEEVDEAVLMKLQRKQKIEDFFGLIEFRFDFIKCLQVVFCNLDASSLEKIEQYFLDVIKLMLDMSSSASSLEKIEQYFLDVVKLMLDMSSAKVMAWF